MRIAVIIPVVQVKHAHVLLIRMANNTIKPDQTIVIDNSECGMCPSYTMHAALNRFTYRRQPPQQLDPFVPGLGTNEAWKLGFSLVHPSIDLVCVFNDDIIINTHFFEITLLAFAKAPKQVAMAVPTPVSKVEHIYHTKPSPDTKIITTRTRVGYAWCILKGVLDTIPPIPDVLKIWYGDNWIMAHVHRVNRTIMQMRANRIYHHGHSTVSALKGPWFKGGLGSMHRMRQQELVEYKKVMRETKDRSKKPRGPAVIRGQRNQVCVGAKNILP